MGFEDYEVGNRTSIKDANIMILGRPYGPILTLSFGPLGLDIGVFSSIMSTRINEFGVTLRFSVLRPLRIESYTRWTITK